MANRGEVQCTRGTGSRRINVYRTKMLQGGEEQENGSGTAGSPVEEKSAVSSPTTENEEAPVAAAAAAAAAAVVGERTRSRLSVGWFSLRLHERRAAH